jgi:hypothetical protein
MKDLFLYPELIPQEVKKILDSFDEDCEDTYSELARLVDDLEKIGYTFDYYLDAEPYNLREL